MVRTPSNFLQEVYVEAYTRADAVAAAEHSTGGKCINANPHYDISSSSNSASGSSDSAEVNGGLILFGLALMLLIYAWKWIILIGGISLVIWFIIQFANDN
jgi:hypothetical protein